MPATSADIRYARQNHLSIQPWMIGTLSSSCSSRNLIASRPRVMCRLSSDWAEKPKDIVGMSPLKLAPLMKGTNSRLVSRYSKLNEMEIRNSNGPAVIASSNKDLGTDRYQTRSCIFDQLWNPP
jgi:hypothetical protein